MANWITRLALETESKSSNPSIGKLVIFLGFFSSSFFFFPHHVTSLSLTMPVGLWIQVLRLSTGEAKKENLPRKILAAPSMEAKFRSKFDVWERGFKNDTYTL